MTRKRRVGIVVTRAGIPSETWIQRQFLAFQEIEPVLFHWEMDDASLLPPGTERRQFSNPFHRKLPAPKKLAARLGLAYGATPTSGELADIRRTVEAADVEALFCHFAWTGLAISSALAGQLPILWQVHGRDLTVKLKEPAYRRALTRILPTVDQIITVGAHQSDILDGLGWRKPRCLIPCGAKVSDFAGWPTPERAEGEACRFITVSRVSAEKGIAETIKAFDWLSAQRPDVELVIVGGGPLLDWARGHVATLSSRDRIRITGRVTDAQLHEELRQAHVFVQHSMDVNGWIEGFGVSITEGGASGLPLVVAGIGGVLDQVEDGENGLLFPSGDFEAQGRQMLRLVDDEPLRRGMGAKAREIAARFDAVTLAHKIEAEILNTLR